ncbi:Glycosyltransferase family 57 protein [Mycena indigotica]|uniref:Glycosyltransferase family 57 protein n=1 Tax=Mycena indigotica TaxID=2126181 RepID=A0A8H6SG84_9AGAR|nr:Glycosyltransferase family 57 protein [Mycena indigotica]KAF7298941.1 Glycosyltransferase family 57 protein [Mycena indigotica]
MRFTARVWKSFLENKGHDAQCFPNLKLISAKPGVVTASLQVEPYNVNRVGTGQLFHGGLILSLTDTLGSLAVATKGQYMTGVSTDIGTSFVRPAGRPGDILHMKSELIGMGKSLAYSRTEFTNSDGLLLAYGYHTKYVGKSSSHPKNVVLSEDGETLLEGADVD